MQAVTVEGVLRNGAIRVLAAAFIAAMAVSGGGGASAQPAGLSQEGFAAWLPQLRAQAFAAGVSRDTIDQVFPALSFSARVVELDQAQPGGTAGSSATPPFAPYQIG